MRYDGGASPLSERKVTPLRWAEDRERNAFIALLYSKSADKDVELKFTTSKVRALTLNSTVPSPARQFDNQNEVS